jgi:aryl-alcohol dehydrogenase-like predicted oxidoreductase
MGERKLSHRAVESTSRMCDREQGGAVACGLVQRRPLGNGGPEISVVGFGSWEAGGAHWGPNQSERQVIGAIHAGLDAGMTWVDTAEVYGQGISERLVGRAVADRREHAMVFTKVAPDEGSGLRPEQIHAAIDASLERLGLDHVDLYQVHWPADDVPLEETWGAMAQLVEAGKARRIGVSNFDRPRVETCQAIHPVASVQNEFSLLSRGDQRELLPWLAEQGIAYLAYSPLAAGRLTGAMRPDHTFGNDDWRSGRGEFADWRDEGQEWGFDPGPLGRDLARVEQMRPIAERLGVSVAALALRWALEQTGVTAVIAGSRSAEHTRDNAVAGEIELPADLRQELDQLFA